MKEDNNAINSQTMKWKERTSPQRSSPSPTGHPNDEIFSNLFEKPVLLSRLISCEDNSVHCIYIPA